MRNLVEHPMKNHTFGGYPSIDAFVKAKLKRLDGMERSFATLFELMFAERENTLYEKSEDYRIVKITYGEAYQSILGKTMTLRNILRNIPAGSVVGIHMQNSLEWIELFWAVLRCGYRPLLMNLRLDRETLESALADCDARAVISDGAQFSVRTILAQEIAAAEAADPAAEYGTEILLMSSGTSEHLKICAYTAEELCHQLHDTYRIIAESKQIKKHYNGELKLLTFLPFYHVFGLMAVYVWFAFFSRTFVQLDDMAPQTIVNTIRRHNVTHVFAVPLFWEKVHQQAMKTIKDRGEETYHRFSRGLRISGTIGGVPVLGSLFRRVAFREVRDKLFGESICFMITGGSVISSQVMEFFNGIGYHLADGYGMTELGITSVELSGRRKLLNDCYVGVPMASVEYKIDEKGELLVRSKTAASYIMEGGKVTRRSEWFHTGDLAVSRQGHYQILGRVDDLVVSSTGENLNPNLIEQRLAVPGIRGVCLIGGADGKTPVLLACVDPGVTEEELAALEGDLRERLAELQLSGQINKLVFVAEPLMLEQEFKLNRRRLAREYAAGRLQLVDAGRNKAAAEGDDLLLRIRGMFAQALGKEPEEIDDAADFFLDEGGSSLDYLGLLYQLQEEFSLSVPEVNDKTASSVKELYEYIKVATEDAD